MKIEYTGFTPSTKEELYFQQKLNHYCDLLPWNSFFKIEFIKEENLYKSEMMLHAVHEEYNFTFKSRSFTDLKELMDVTLEELHHKIDHWHELRNANQRSSS